MLHDFSPSKGAEVVRATVLQGEVRASADPSLEINTVLGSCIATCLYDPIARVGGMNHFLLAEPPAGASRDTVDEHYGVYLMELLINNMLTFGAAKQRMKARIYGGANMRVGWQPIGTVNAQFARQFLQRERIELLFEDTGGSCARRVHFRPASGQVRCKRTENTPMPTVAPAPRPSQCTGDVELF